MKIESDANSFGFVFELVKESANSVMKRPEANKSDLERSDTEQYTRKPRKENNLNHLVTKILILKIPI